MRLKLVVSALLVLLALPASASAGNPWDLDPTFGGDGITQVDFGADLDFETLDTAVQTNGRSIQVGWLRTDPNTAGEQFTPAVIRLKHDGSLDTSFSGDGIFQYTDKSSPGTTAASRFNRVAVDSLGRIVVSGFIGDDYDAENASAFMIRLTSAGVVDLAGFAGVGADDLIIQDFVVEADSSIVYASTEWNSGDGEDHVWLRKLSSAGVPPVAGFTPAARQVSSGDTQVTAMGKTTDGYVVSVYQAWGSSFTLKYEADGDTDATYGTAGRSFQSFIGGTAYPDGDNVTELAVAADDSVWLTGFHGVNDNGFVTHLPADGQNTGGFLTYTNTSSYVMSADNVELWDIVIQNGKPILSGYADWGSSTPVLIRVDPATLQRDPTWLGPLPLTLTGAAWLVSYPQGGTFVGVSLLPDGRLFAGGNTWDNTNAVSDLTSARFGREPDTDGDGRGDFSADACPTITDVLNPRNPRNGCPAGTAGADVFSGTSGPNKFYGGTGGDRCDGKAGNDVCNGQAGNDTCIAGAGNDVCNGGSGNDVCIAKGGTDKCIGGSGNDRSNTRDGRGGDLNNGGPGRRDSCTGDKRDKFKGCERITRR